MTWAELAVVRRAVLAALRRRRRQVLRLAAWSSVEALPALLSGLLTARATDEGFLAGRPMVGLGWLAGLAAAVLLGAYGTFRVHRCLAEVVEPFRDELLHRAVAGALHRSTAAGAAADTAAVARMTHQVEIVRDTFAGLVMVVRGFLFTAGAAMIGLFSLAPVVVLLVSPPLLAGLALFVTTLPRMVAWQRRYVLADERLAERATEVVRGRRDVQACGAEQRAGAAVGGQIDAQAAAERALARMAAVRGISLGVGGWLPLVVLLAASPWLAGQAMTTGAILGALVYVLHGLQPALYTLVRGLGGGGLRLAVTLDRLLSTTESPTPAPARGPDETPARPPDAEHGDAGGGAAVLLRGVTFRYGPHAEPVVRDLDLSVGPSEHLAIVGPSGIGKSTLAGLMAGVLRPQAGEVSIAGAPLAQAGPGDLATRRVLIPQEAYVFTGTVWDNLTYLRPGIDRSTVDEVVRRLGLAPLVARLGGYAAEIAPGSLSAGGRQLIALARAYLSPAELVLLDEATCHLDPAAETRVEFAFAQRPGAMVVVAHRISSALRAQRVLVMDGVTLDIGGHEELLARSSRYRDLVGHWQVTTVPA